MSIKVVAPPEAPQDASVPATPLRHPRNVRRLGATLNLAHNRLIGVAQEVGVPLEAVSNLPVARQRSAEPEDEVMGFEWHEGNLKAIVGPPGGPWRSIFVAALFFRRPLVDE